MAWWKPDGSHICLSLRAGETSQMGRIRTKKAPFTWLMSPALCFGTRNQLYGKVCTVAAGVMKRFEVLLGEPVGLLGHAVVVCLPDLLGILAVF